MSFSKGFNKVAVVKEAALPGAGMVGSLLGKAKQGVKGLSSAIREGAAATKQNFSEGFRGAAGKAPSGTTLGAASVSNENRRRAAKGLAGLGQEEASALQLGKAQKMQERAKNIQGIREKNKMTFSQKHPVLTTLGVLGAGKAVFGGGDQQQTPPPVAYGSQYYG